MRNGEVVNVPDHCLLVTINVAVSNAWIVGIEFEADGAKIGNQLAVEEESTFEHAIDGFLCLKVEKWAAFLVGGDVLAVDVRSCFDHEFSQDATKANDGEVLVVGMEEGSG